MGSSEDAARYPAAASLSTEVDQVARDAGVVGAATLASRVLGLVRDIVLANLFLARSTDAFFIAFMIPNLFRRLIGEGALTVAFVPIFTGSLARSRAEARYVFNATWTLAALAGALIVLLGSIFAEPLVRIFAAGFAQEPGKFELCVRLLRICFPYIFLLTLVAVAMGALNALGHFFRPAIAPVLLNLCLIAGAVSGAIWFDPPILALGAAVLLAGVLQVLLQVPELVRRGMAPRPVLALGHPAVRRLGSLMAPAVLGASVYQLNLIVVRFLSSFQGDGAVSYLYYADRLLELPLGVFVFALGAASLPSFSRLAKQGEHEALRGAFAGTLGMALALALPSTVGLVLLREPLFGALFAWNPGVFGPEAVQGCAQALLCYALGLVPITMSRIVVQLCVANENTRTPAWAAAVGLTVNVIAALALIAPLDPATLPSGFGQALVAFQRSIDVAHFGYAGLALATSIAALANLVYLLAAARHRYGALLRAGDWLDYGRLALASLGMGAAVWFGLSRLPVPAQATPLALALLAAHVAFGVLVYLGLLALLRSPELGMLRALLSGRRGQSDGDAGL
jgi:putative peptidoglycan lipid II flippase